MYDIELFLNNLCCAQCASVIEEKISRLPGVAFVRVSVVTATALIKAEKTSNRSDLLSSVTRIIKAIEPGIQIALKRPTDGVTEQPKRSRNAVWRIGIAAILFAAALFTPVYTVSLGLFIAAWLLAGFDVLIKVIRNLCHGIVFDENFLMAIATIGAFAIGEYPEAAAVMLFYQTGEMLQNYAADKSRRSIASIMSIRAETANRKTASGIAQIAASEIETDDILIIKPGETIPADGIISKGVSALDTAALTGESAPRHIAEGNAVMSGCVNLIGLLEMRVTAKAAESTAARIIDLVENSAAKKSRTENFITRFARYYTPVIVAMAAIIAIIPPLIGGEPLADWIYRGLVFLVVSCPCALVISIPLGFFGGIGGAAKKGVLIKGGNHLETLAKAKTAVFDKTGTLTCGSLKTKEIIPVGCDENTLLNLAAHAEYFSNHPAGKAVTETWRNRGGEIFPGRTGDFTEIPGRGVYALVDGRQVLVGSAALLAERGVALPSAIPGGSLAHIAVDGLYSGHILIADEVKKDAAAAIDELTRMGIKTVMLTGDSKETAEKIADELSITEFAAELLPQDKVEKLERLLSLSANRSVLFAGDGLNDAPVLARADAGIAMGGIGSDAAIEAADIVIMTDEPSKIPLAISHARRTMRIVKQNIALALSVKAAVLLLGAIGLANMWGAVFADVGVAVLAVLNSMRTLRKN